MDNKFINYYIETLVSTLNDAIIRNVSLQANAKVTDEVIKGHSNEIDKMVDNYEKKIKEQYETINSLTKEITQLQHIKCEYEKIKDQHQHLESFKSEIVKCREENKKLQSELQSTKFPQTKKKKQTSNTKPIINDADLIEENTSKDGGIF